MRVKCMGWPTPASRCEQPASEVGHGLWLCIPCQETASVDLKRVSEARKQANRQIAQLSEQQAGYQPVRQPMLPARGEMLAGRFEENRSKH